jgi:hypothetical protein
MQLIYNTIFNKKPSSDDPKRMPTGQALGRAWSWLKGVISSFFTSAEKTDQVGRRTIENTATMNTVAPAHQEDFATGQNEKALYQIRRSMSDLGDAILSAYQNEKKILVNQLNTLNQEENDYQKRNMHAKRPPSYFELQINKKNLLLKINKITNLLKAVEQAKKELTDLHKKLEDEPVSETLFSEIEYVAMLLGEEKFDDVKHWKSLAIEFLNIREEISSNKSSRDEKNSSLISTIAQIDQNSDTRSEAKTKAQQNCHSDETASSSQSQPGTFAQTQSIEISSIVTNGQSPGKTKDVQSKKELSNEDAQGPLKLNLKDIPANILKVIVLEECEKRLESFELNPAYSFQGRLQNFNDQNLDHDRKIRLLDSLVYQTKCTIEYTIGKNYNFNLNDIINNNQEKIKAAISNQQHYEIENNNQITNTESVVKKGDLVYSKVLLGTHNPIPQRGSLNHKPKGNRKTSKIKTKSSSILPDENNNTITSGHANGTRESTNSYSSNF